jgi:hypothetical protein
LLFKEDIIMNRLFVGIAGAVTCIVGVRAWETDYSIAQQERGREGGYSLTSFGDQLGDIPHAFDTIVLRDDTNLQPHDFPLGRAMGDLALAGAGAGIVGVSIIGKRK